MLHIKYLTLIFGIVLLIGIVSSATYYVTDPDNCPSSDGTNFPGQNCAPQDICGDSSGIAQCYDTSTMNPPAGSSTTTGTGGTNYACSDATCDGGFITNCYATIDSGAPYCDNNGAYLIDRNATCYNKHVQTTATGGAFATSTCSATCTTNYFQCDGSSEDSDGCEILAGSSCGSGTGTVVYNQCYSSTQGNCTSSTRLDCDNSDSDGNPSTCNVGNGCEILIGGSCSVGSLSGTYGSTCTGSSGTCILTPQHFITSTNAEYQSNATNPFLWGTDYFLGTLLNLSWSNGGGIHVNASGIYFNNTLLGSGGAETDPYWTANQTNYYNKTYVFNKTEILGFSYYNATSFDINDYYLKSNPFSFWNSTFAAFNKTYADILYYGISNPSGFFNTSNTFNCTSGQVVMNLTLNSTGAYGKCISPTLSESDPLWSANYTLYNASWSSITNTSYYLASNPFSFWNSTFATFNKTYADTLYYSISNPLNFINQTYGNATYALNTSLANYRTLTNNTFTGGMNITSGNLNVTSGNISLSNRIKLAIGDCSGLTAGEICRNATAIYIQG